MSAALPAATGVDMDVPACGKEGRGGKRVRR